MFFQYVKYVKLQIKLYNVLKMIKYAKSIGVRSQKGRVRLKLGFFSDANVLKKRPDTYPKVRVRLI